MAYIGKQPVVGNFVKLDAIVTSATATYNLLNGGTAYYPQTANNCIVSLNGVIQSPTSAYTISGSTIVFDSALTSSDSIDFILVLGDVLSIGTPSDGTVTSAKLASGTTGLIAWQSVQTTGFTASAGRGYPLNTTSAAFTVTLPASPSAGDTIILLDYAGTFATNKLTIARNGSNIEGGTTNKLLTTNREATTITYIDSTQGWVASSGANEGSQSLDPTTYSADFLVIAGGGSGGKTTVVGGAGGGAGGYRNSYSTETSGGGGSSEASLTFSIGTVYTITVGAGGAAATVQGNGNSGVSSSISGTGITTITSAGGGAGVSNTATSISGGSGGGAAGAANHTGGAGTANQGYAGGNTVNSSGYQVGGGGGGASAVGANGTSSGSTGVGGNGGAGLASSITGSSVTRAGGGAGGADTRIGATQGNGGSGGGGGAGSGTGGSGTVNTGSGGGAGGTGDSGAGGSGVVILRMPTASYSGTTTGSPTATTSGADTILVYNASGTYTG